MARNVSSLTRSIEGLAGRTELIEQTLTIVNAGHVLLVIKCRLSIAMVSPVEQQNQKEGSMNQLISASIVVVLVTIGAIPYAGADDKIAATNYYSAYYDGHYGEIVDGYWGRHGKFFWYKDLGGTWRQDDGSHFQHEPATGFVMVHGSGIARQH